MWELYDALIGGVDSVEPLDEVVMGDAWTMVTSGGRCGVAMSIPAQSRPRLFRGDYQGLPLREAAGLVKSWNLAEGGVGMAAINAFYNTKERLDRYGARQPEHEFCTAGIELAGKRVGFIGHFRMQGDPLAEAEDTVILEKRPQPGDYPDSACEYLLDGCGVVVITGSALTNKTMPRLLQLCRKSVVVLAGPSVPMTPRLFDFGVFRLAGLIVTNPVKMKEFVLSGRHGPPYQYGEWFRLDHQSEKEMIN
ncbi:Rossmann-like domain-containing protein [Caproicibacter sp.]|uniref:Rossmann-like domain-containing protein n=1 Tax=Caproicibacter sp. TaxID=2814884 RepID=UPI003988D054